MSVFCRPAVSILYSGCQSIVGSKNRKPLLPLLIFGLMIFSMRNTKTRFFLLLIFIVSLLLILIVIKVFEKRIKKIEKQGAGSITGKTDNRHYSQPKQNFYA
jgi:predicted permease